MAPRSFIRVIEVWVPDETGTLLVLGSAHYGAATRFGASSRRMCFGRGEGLPGQAWEAGHPIVLTAFEGSSFRRTAAAHADGLSCGIALPVFKKNALQAVVLIFCGDGPQPDQPDQPPLAGAIELWHNDAAQGQDLRLHDGYYGATGDAFEFISRRTAFRKGTGLPGLAWESGLPVFMPDLGKGGRFLRADSAQKVGINRGFAFLCNSVGQDSWVLAFLSALATPIVQRLEIWQPMVGGGLRLSEGFCETAGPLEAGSTDAAPALRRALANAIPQIDSPAGGSATPLFALPLLHQGQVAAVLAWTL